MHRWRALRNYRAETGGFGSEKTGALYPKRSHVRRARFFGYLTPPVGLNLFISSFRFERSIADVFRATFPFFILLLVSVVIIAYWPALSLVLLN